MADDVVLHERDRRIAAALAETGYCIVPEFLPASITGPLARECTGLWQAGQFHAAGIGRGGEHQVRRDIRSDHVLWLDGAFATPMQRVYLNELEGLRQAINSRLFLGLFEFEGHFAIYQPGTFYKKHLDRFRGVEARTVTCVLYLNEGWREDEGGQLRFYLHGQSEESYLDVPPEAGTLACFLSGEYYHEVLPAQRERMSVTGWFKTR